MQLYILFFEKKKKMQSVCASKTSITIYETEKIYDEIILNNNCSLQKLL